jgi:Leucine-rich repeat (LRR) protein
VTALHTLGAADWRELLHSVVLEGQRLRGVQGLAAAHNLVAANLADNLISNLAELAACSKLQRLDISNNLAAEVGRQRRGR